MPTLTIGAIADLSLTEDSESQYLILNISGNTGPLEDVVITAHGDFASISIPETYWTGTDWVVMFDVQPETAGTSSVYIFAGEQAEMNFCSFTVEVVLSDDAPIAEADAVVTAVDTPILLYAGGSPDSITLNDWESDQDMMDFFTPNVLTVQHGTAAFDNGALVFTPDPGFVGVAYLEYDITDGTTTSNAASVFISVGVPIVPLEHFYNTPLAMIGAFVSPLTDGRILRLDLGITQNGWRTIADGIENTRDAVAGNAISYDESLTWKKDGVKDNFAKGTNKCNKFVFDVAIEVGATVPLTRGGLPLFRTSPPLANDWADTKQKRIGDWVIVDGPPKPGDIIAIANQAGSGHCGIVVGENQTASANAGAMPAGKITINDWGFRAGQQPVIRRYQPR